VRTPPPLLDPYGIPMGSLWDPYRIPMGSLWDRYGIPMGRSLTPFDYNLNRNKNQKEEGWIKGV